MSKKDIGTPTLEQIEAELRKEQRKSRHIRVLKNTIYTLLVAAAAAVIIAVLAFPVLQINGTSMTEALQDGDIVIAMNTSGYKTGEIIAFYHNNQILVKRVIAVSGDWVDIDGDGNVYVNDKLLEEPYISEKAIGECDITLPYQVPEKKIFVLGDHRSTSIDSRSTEVGCVGEDLIIGKILFCVWPLPDFGTVK